MTAARGDEGGRVAVRVARLALPGFPSRAGDRAAGRAGALLQLRAPDGRTGWGEASPLPGYAEETPARAAASLLALAASPAGRSALADAVADPGAAAGRLSSATEAGAADGAEDPLPGMPGVSLPPSARAALVSALFDLAGRTGGIPVRVLLGARPPGPEGLAPVALNALVSLGEPGEAARAARAAVGRGIATLKAKLGPAERFDSDLASLRAIREAVGPDVAVRLDANGLWSVSEARRLLPVLAAEIQPAYVEEPVPPGRLAELAGAPVPLAADESLRDPARAGRLLEEGAISVVILKPGPLGGLDRCLDLARRARERGVAAVVTHAFEGPVGHAAACELALALRNGAAGSPEVAPAGPPGRGLACGLDAHPALAVRPDVPVPQLRPSSVVPASVSGLGVDATPLLAPDAAPPGSP